MSGGSSQVHDMCVAYALSGLDPIDRLRYEAHLVDCATCRGDVDDVRDAAELLSVGIELAPPDGLRERVLAVTELAAEPTRQATKTTPEPTPAPSRRRRWFGNGG